MIARGETVALSPAVKGLSEKPRVRHIYWGKRAFAFAPGKPLAFFWLPIEEHANQSLTAGFGCIYA
jgi:hypothetical protein